MKLYWITFDKRDGLPVEFPAFSEANRRFLWFGVYGLQIGPWFIGTVKGVGAPAGLGLANSGETENG